jgi:tRNA pseudouridine38-40 synthase
MSRYVMKVAYDGTNYYGWQVQHQQRTVQHTIEKALQEFCGKKTSLTGSGRTDTGVHALGQYAHFNYKGSASPEQMRKGLRRFLPDDIQILKIFKATPDFHARYDAYERCYHYLIANTETPFNRLYQGSFPRKKIDLDLLQKAAPYFLGEHDFSSFSKLNPAVPDHVCTVYQSDFVIHENHYKYTIRANRFLHNMVRRIVGALINVSHLELEPTIILEWLEQKQPRQTIIFPAPPQGLYLADVLYPDNKIIDD